MTNRKQGPKSLAISQKRQRVTRLTMWLTGAVTLCACLVVL